MSGRGNIMEKNMFEMMQMHNRQNELANLLSCNEKTEKFGLTLRQKDVTELVEFRSDCLKRHKRVEFPMGKHSNGNTPLEKIIFSFCDSDFIEQDNYVEILEELLDVFYEFRNELEDKLTDDELIAFMREQFDGVCFGDVEYLSGTCLTRYGSEVRKGYTGYEESGGEGEYNQFSEETRWDKDLYMEVLREIFWG